MRQVCFSYNTVIIDLSPVTQPPEEKVLRAMLTEFYCPHWLRHYCRFYCTCLPCSEEWFGCANSEECYFCVATGSKCVKWRRIRPWCSVDGKCTRSVGGGVCAGTLMDPFIRRGSHRTRERVRDSFPCHQSRRSQWIISNGCLRRVSQEL